MTARPENAMALQTFVKLFVGFINIIGYQAADIIRVGIDNAPDIDEIIQETGLGAGKTLGILMTLETKGAIAQSPGKFFSRVGALVEIGSNN